MNESEGAFVLSDLGFTGIKIGNGVVKARCKDCGKGANDHTFCLILSDGGSGYYCHRCHIRGRLVGLVWQVMLSEGRDHPESMMVIHESEENYRRASSVPERLDYMPMSERAVTRRGAGPIKYVPVSGVQIGLIGKQIPAPKVFSEEDLGRYTVGDREYMYSRGFDTETLDAWQIKTDQRNWRVVFPIRDWECTIKGVSRRLVWDRDWCFQCKGDLVVKGSRVRRCSCGVLYAKYLHSKGMSRNKVLYGEWLAEGALVPILCEGMTDAMNLWMRGLRPSVGAAPLAVMGSNVGAGQIGRISERMSPTTIFVIKDRDDPSKYPNLPEGVAPGDELVSSVRKYVDQIIPGCQVVEVIPPMVGMDPGDLSGEHVSQIVDLVKNVIAGDRVSDMILIA